MTTKTPIKALLVYMLFQPSIGQVQSTDEQPTAESNIVCIAAKKKWVCAPGDQLQEAEEKARTLALEPEEIDTVEIQTLQPVNIAQQVRNEQLPYAIADFIARDDVFNEAEKPVQTETTITENTVVETAPTQAEPISTASTSQPVIVAQTTEPNTESQQFQRATTDFSYWRENYAQQWTFQVVGTSNRHHIDGFIQQHGLEDANYTIVKTLRDGADWWIVLTGLYNSKEQAKSQQHTLPSALANGAWLRQISSIKGQSG